MLLLGHVGFLIVVHCFIGLGIVLFIKFLLLLLLDFLLNLVLVLRRTLASSDQVVNRVCHPCRAGRVAEVLAELLLVCENGFSGKEIPEGKAGAFLDALVAAVEDEESGKKVLDNFYGSRAVRNLVVVSGSEGKSVFAKKLHPLVKKKAKKWKGSHAEKIVRAYDKIK